MSHEDVNRQNDIARRLSNSFGTGNQTTLQSKSLNIGAAMPPWHQYIVEVTENLSAGNENADPNTYRCKLRYYNPTARRWVSQATDRLLDSSDLGSLQVGDKLVAWWNEQRGAFIPVIGGSSARLYPFRNDSEETVPAYGCMAVTGAATADDGSLVLDPNGNVVLATEKPNTTFRRYYVLNAGEAVGYGRFGLCFTPGGYDTVIALYAAGSPTLGQSFGPTPGQWYLSMYYPPIFQLLSVLSVADGTMLGHLHSLEQITGELKTSITPGGSADAYVLAGSAGSYEAITDDDTFTVWDITNRIRARGKDDAGEVGEDDGARFVAQRGAVDDWIIVEIQQQAKRCTGQLYAALDETDETIIVVNVNPTDGGQTPADSVTAYNQRNPSGDGGFEGDNNAIVKIEWDENNDRWELYDVPCPA